MNGRVVELRIHGVGGGSAQDQLGDEVVPIGGARDDLAGFWEHPEPVGDPPRTRQVYSWGGFSGRNVTRALWVLLLPFTVVNVAGWMIDPAAGPLLTALQRALVRVVAFLSTVLLLVWVAVVAFDGFGGLPLGRRVAAAGAVALVVLVAVAVAAIRSHRYEEFGTESAAVPAPPGVDAASDDDLGLADPEFWQTAPVIAAVRRSELAVAACAVGFLPAISMWRLAESRLSLALAAAAIVVSTAALADGLLRRPGPIATWLAAGAAAVAVAALADSWLADVPEPATALDGMWSSAPLWVLLAAGLAVLALGLVECLAWRRRDGGVVVWTGGLRAGQARLVAVAGGVGAVAVAAGAADGAPSLQPWWAAALGALTVALPLGWAVARGFRPDGLLWRVAAAGAGFGALLFWYLDWMDGRLVPPTWAGGYLVGTVLVALPAVVVLLASRRTTTEVACALVAVATGMVAAAGRDVWWVAVGVGVALFAVAAVAETGRRDRFRWLPATTVSGLALLLLAVTGSGLTRLVDLGPGSSSPSPTGYEWVTGVFAGALLAAALGSAAHLLHRRREAWPPGRVTEEYWGQAEPCRTVMATKAGRRRAVADLVGDVDVVVTVLVWTAGAALLAGVARMGRPGSELWSVDRLHLALTGNPWPEAWSWLGTVGAVVGVALPVAAVALVAASLRFPAIRSKVAVVWDVGTFWPRRYHPLAPPAYAERAVPELVGHVARLVREGTGVVVVGHSQGSVLTLATAVQLDGVDPHRLAALTHGSPLGRFYRRFWPGEFGGGLAAGVATAWSGESGGVERWWNVHRLSDPIGGLLFTGPDERVGTTPTDLCLPDPRPALTGCPEPKGHLGHLSDPEVRAKLDELGAAVSP